MGASKRLINIVSITMFSILSYSLSFYASFLTLVSCRSNIWRQKLFLVFQIYTFSPFTKTHSLVNIIYLDLEYSSVSNHSPCEVPEVPTYQLCSMQFCEDLHQSTHVLQIHRSPRQSFKIKNLTSSLVIRYISHASSNFLLLHTLKNIGRNFFNNIMNLIA